MKNLKNAFFIILIAAAIVTAGLAADASTDHHGTAHFLPGDLVRIFYHSINLLILFGGLIYLLRPKVKEFFASRGVAYQQALQKAEQARHEAESHFIEMKSRLKSLHETAEASVVRATTDAHAQKEQMIAEAQKTANRIQTETENTIKIEDDQALYHLREELINQSVTTAEVFLRETVGEKEEQRLKSEFIQKIQVLI